MFNVNLLGAPGIQPETVDSSISFRNGNSVNRKKIKSKRKPGIISKSGKFFRSKADWIGFTLTAVLLIFLLGPGGKFLGITGQTQSNGADISTNYKTISGLLDHLENLNENVSLQKLTTGVDFIKLKLLSKEQVELLLISNELQSYPSAVNRINGDSTSVYGLSYESPWIIKIDKNNVITPLQNSGDLSVTIVAIKQLISDEIIHRGIMTIELIETNNYQMTFTSVNKEF